MSENYLMGEDRARKLARIALEHSSADQTEVSISSGKSALTRFANSYIHQNMASSDAGVQVRAVIGKKIAAASTNRVDEDGIRAVVDQAVEMARLQDPNPDFVSLPEPQGPVPSVDCWRPATAANTPEERARSVESIVSEAGKAEATAAGSYSVSASDRVVMNSLGIQGYTRSTYAALTTVVTAPDGGFGYGSSVARDVVDIDARAIGEEAAARARESRNPQGLEPGDYECVLMPYAVSNIVGYLRWMGFGALDYQQGQSFTCGKLGTKMVDERVNIWDDGLDPRTLVNPFDSEGVPKQRVDLFKDGVATSLLYDSYTAHREGKKSTGHASSSNLIMAPGDASVEEMITATRRGLLVTRFHYANIAHLMTASVTGMTRDGTFLIENGKIVRPVKNLRFTQSYTEALSHLDMIGRDLKLVNGTLVPAIKVNKFRFSSATEF